MNEDEQTEEMTIPEITLTSQKRAIDVLCTIQISIALQQLCVFSYKNGSDEKQVTGQAADAWIENGLIMLKLREYAGTYSGISKATVFRHEILDNTTE